MWGLRVVGKADSEGGSGEGVGARLVVEREAEAGWAPVERNCRDAEMGEKRCASPTVKTAVRESGWESHWRAVSEKARRAG